MLKGKNLQPRITYLAGLSFRTEGEVKNFSDMQKLRVLYETYLKRNVKESSLSGKEKAITRSKYI